MSSLPLVVHALAATLGLGQVAAMAIVAGAARSDGGPAPSQWVALRRLMTVSRASFGVMLGSGVLMDLAAGGAFHRTWWFRLSVALLLVIGFVHLRSQSALRGGPAASTKDANALLAGIRSRAWLVCTGIAVITILMELKPW